MPVFTIKQQKCCGARFERTPCEDTHNTYGIEAIFSKSSYNYLKTKLLLYVRISFQRHTQYSAKLQETKNMFEKDTLRKHELSAFLIIDFSFQGGIGVTFYCMKFHFAAFHLIPTQILCHKFHVTPYNILPTLH